MKILLRTAAAALLCAAALLLYPYLPDHSSPADLSVPDYEGTPFTQINENRPLFEDAAPAPYERYAPPDLLGRCGAAEACLSPELMPTQDREPIGQVRPSGWHTVRYDDLIEDKYLYNRCHLIGFQLTGENANERNLITGTRYFNVEGMLPFENAVADYIRTSGNRVLYRVTPDFRENELVARGVRMEALSVEDGGEGICFHVYVYNVQPGVTIDYATGESRRTQPSSPDLPETAPEAAPAPPAQEHSEAPGTPTYILNLRSGKFHAPSCSGAADISPSNRQDFFGTREEALAQGYSPCGQCKP